MNLSSASNKAQLWQAVAAAPLLLILTEGSVSSDSQIRDWNTQRPKAATTKPATTPPAPAPTLQQGSQRISDMAPDKLHSLEGRRMTVQNPDNFFGPPATGILKFDSNYPQHFYLEKADGSKAYYPLTSPATITPAVTLQPVPAHTSTFQQNSSSSWPSTAAVPATPNTMTYADKVAKSSHVEAMQDLEDVRQACGKSSELQRPENEGNVNYAIETYLSAASDPTGMGGGTEKSREYKTRTWNLQAIQAMKTDRADAAQQLVDQKCRAALYAQAIRDQYQYSQDMEKLYCPGGTEPSAQCKKWRGNTAYIARYYSSLVEDLKTKKLMDSIYGCGAPPCEADQRILNTLRDVWDVAGLGGLITQTAAAAQPAKLDDDLKQSVRGPVAGNNEAAAAGAGPSLRDLEKNPLSLDCGNGKKNFNPLAPDSPNPQQCRDDLAAALKKQQDEQIAKCDKPTDCSFGDIGKDIEDRITANQQQRADLEQGQRLLAELGKKYKCETEKTSDNCQKIVSVNININGKISALQAERVVLDKAKTENDRLIVQHRKFQEDYTAAEAAAKKLGALDLASADPLALAQAAARNKQILRSDGQVDADKTAKLTAEAAKIAGTGQDEALGAFQDKMAARVKPFAGYGAALEAEIHKNYLPPQAELKRFNDISHQDSPLPIAAQKELLDYPVQTLRPQLDNNNFQNQFAVKDRNTYKSQRAAYTREIDILGDKIANCQKDKCAGLKTYQCARSQLQMSLQLFDYYNVGHKQLRITETDIAPLNRARRNYQTLGCTTAWN